MKFTELLDQLWHLSTVENRPKLTADRRTAEQIIATVDSYLVEDKPELGIAEFAAVARATTTLAQTRAGHLVEFLSKYAAKRRASTILDPFAQSPYLTASVAAESEAAITAYCPSFETAQLASRFRTKIDWRTENLLQAPIDIDEQFDMLLTSPPFGLQLGPKVAAPIERLNRSDAALALIVGAAPTVDEIVFVSTDTFWWRADGIAARERLRDLGFSPWASISVPNGLGSLARVAMSIEVLRRGENTHLLTGLLTSTTDIDALIENLETHNEARVIELGALVQVSNFRGWDQFHAGWSFDHLVKRSPIDYVPLTSWCGDIRVEKLTAGVQFIAPPNSLFFNSRVSGLVRTEPEPPQKGEARWHEAPVAPDKGDALFLAHWLNDTTAGKLAQRQFFRGSGMPRIARKDIGLIRVPEFSVNEQRSLLSQRSWLIAVRDRADELASLLIDQPWKLREVHLASQQLAETDVLNSWAERLPFVLGSIVRLYQIETDPAKKVDHAIHLFEANAIFLTSALLGAINRSPKATMQSREKLRKSGGHKSPFEEADFGTWINLGRTASKALKRHLTDALESPDQDVARRDVFGIGDEAFVNFLISGEPWEILDRARMIRNEKSHGGLQDGPLMLRNLHQLSQMIDEFRVASNRPFAGIRMLQPGASVKSGGIREYRNARVLTGTNASFADCILTTPATVDVDGTALVLCDAGNPDDFQSDVLELAPLIQMRPSPENEMNAAYYYNRKHRDGDGYQFVSYHFADEVQAPIINVNIDRFVANMVGEEA